MFICKYIFTPDVDDICICSNANLIDLGRLEINKYSILMFGWLDGYFGVSVSFVCKGIT